MTMYFLSDSQKYLKKNCQSFQSDDSGDSDAFVVINRGGGPNSLIGTIDDSVDSTLFTIHSKVVSQIYKLSKTRNIKSWPP